MTTPSLILASSSLYRQTLLSKLHLPFTTYSPNIDESAHTNESPQQLVERLAIDKAKTVANHSPNALIIGSDQVATLNGNIITKPHTHERAKAQLQQARNEKVTFLTGLCLYNSNTQAYQSCVSSYYVHFLQLSDSQIDRYLHKDQPYDCAGSFKSEGLGITLFSKMEGDDPNSLVGLPLIALTEMLRNEGLEPLST